jgi:GT2 family glycosyltransferase
MTSRPDLSIIIVNWNSCHFLRKCLWSIREQRSGIVCEVIVVDNASFDGSGPLVEAEFPEVRFVQSNTNLGFAKANNLGFASSTSRNLLFLNPDTQILGTALAALVTFADSHPDLAIAGPRLLNTDLTLQLESVKAFPSLLNQILDVHVLKIRFPRLSLWGMQPLFDSSRRPATVDVVSGACLLIKREVFEDVGQFSTQYFMYSEDVDLCFKVMQSGWRTYVVPDAQVIHHGGQSSASRPVSQFTAVLMRESRFQFFRRARGDFYAFTFRLSTAVNAICRLVLLVLVAPLFVSVRTKSVTGPLAKWTKVLRWSLGFERWVKNLG